MRNVFARMFRDRRSRTELALTHLIGGPLYMFFGGILTFSHRDFSRWNFAYVALMIVGMVQWWYGIHILIRVVKNERGTLS